LPNPTRRITYDRSDPTILVGCRECPQWLALRLDRIEAYRAGEHHEIQTHSVEPAHAARARVLYEQRHAVSA
jgi:hypothetical protein